VTDVIAGRSDFSVQLTATTLPQIQQGTLVALAVSAHKRWRNYQCADHDRSRPAGGFGLSILQRRLSASQDAARYRRKASRRDRKSAPRTRRCWTGSLRLRRTDAVQPNSIRGVRSDDVAANIALVKAAKIPTQ